MNGPWMDLLFDLVLITFGVLIATVPGHFFTAASNRRQAIQERLYRVESDVRQLENLGIRYWLREGEDSGARELASEIKRTRARVGRELGRLTPGPDNEAAFDSLHLDHPGHHRRRVRGMHAGDGRPDGADRGRGGRPHLRGPRPPPGDLSRPWPGNEPPRSAVSRRGRRRAALRPRRGNLPRQPPTLYRPHAAGGRWRWWRATLARDRGFHRGMNPLPRLLSMTVRGHRRSRTDRPLPAGSGHAPSGREVPVVGPLDNW